VFSVLCLHVARRVRASLPHCRCTWCCLNKWIKRNYWESIQDRIKIQRINKRAQQVWRRETSGVVLTSRQCDGICKWEGYALFAFSCRELNPCVNLHIASSPAAVEGNCKRTRQLENTGSWRIIVVRPYWTHYTGTDCCNQHSCSHHKHSMVLKCWSRQIFVKTFETCSLPHSPTLTSFTCPSRTWYHYSVRNEVSTQNFWSHLD
jgi:hypothetical protein